MNSVSANTVCTLSVAIDRAFFRKRINPTPHPIFPTISKKNPKSQFSAISKRIMSSIARSKPPSKMHSLISSAMVTSDSRSWSGFLTAISDL